VIQDFIDSSSKPAPVVAATDNVADAPAGGEN
jgi:hypothetical protein